MLKQANIRFIICLQRYSEKLLLLVPEYILEHLQQHDLSVPTSWWLQLWIVVEYTRYTMYRTLQTWAMAKFRSQCQWQCFWHSLINANINANIFSDCLSMPMSMAMFFQAPYQCQCQWQLLIICLNVNANVNYFHQFVEVYWN